MGRLGSWQASSFSATPSAAFACHSKALSMSTYLTLSLYSALYNLHIKPHSNPPFPQVFHFSPHTRLKHHAFTAQNKLILCPRGSLYRLWLALIAGFRVRRRIGLDIRIEAHHFPSTSPTHFAGYIPLYYHFSAHFGPSILMNPGLHTTAS